MGYLDGFGVIVRKWLGPNTDTGRRVTTEFPEEVRPKPERFHGRHVLNRYDDGMEKCIGCELCAGVCPAQCIYVRGQDNDPDDPTSPGERFGFVYEINYLRCIHCDLCVEACPTEAITETKLFEFAFTNRDDAIYTKDELLVGDDGQPQRLPWEHWDGGFDPARDSSGWMRATAPNGAAEFVGLVAWAGELGFGVRRPEHDRFPPSDDTVTDEAAADDGHDDAVDHADDHPDDHAGHGHFELAEGAAAGAVATESAPSGSEPVAAEPEPAEIEPAVAAPPDDTHGAPRGRGQFDLGGDVTPEDAADGPPASPDDATTAEEASPGAAPQLRGIFDADLPDEPTPKQTGRGRRRGKGDDR